MKLLSLLTAIGLGLALSVSAQTTTTDEKEKQEPAQTETGKGKGPVQTETGKGKVEERVRPGEERTTTHGAQPGEREKAEANVNAREKSRTETREGGEMRGSTSVSHATTVFRNGRETNERLDLHRGFRERTDVHFSIGTHPRDWWLQTYSIVFIDGCHYYLADNGCWYPAYGFDPACNYPDGVVYCD